MTNCITNNPYCIDGWHVEEGKDVTACPCVKKKAVDKTYDVFGGFHPKLKKHFTELESNNVREFDYVNNANKGVQDYHELGAKMIHHLKTMISLNAKVFIYGVPGTGKSQFVSSLALEAAEEYEILSYYIESKDLYDAVFDFTDRGKEKLQSIKAKVQHPRVKVLVIDDMGSELSKNDNRLVELLTVYNNLIRDFQKKNGLLVITSNFNPKDFVNIYNDQRLLDVTFQAGRTKYYEFSPKNKFRQQHDPDELNFLD